MWSAILRITSRTKGGLASKAPSVGLNSKKLPRLLKKSAQNESEDEKKKKKRPQSRVRPLLPRERHDYNHCDILSSGEELSGLIRRTGFTNVIESARAKQMRNGAVWLRPR